MRFGNVTTKRAKHYLVHNITNTTLYRGLLYYYSITMSIIQPKASLSGQQRWELGMVDGEIDLIIAADSNEHFLSDRATYFFDVFLNQDWDATINLAEALFVEVKKGAIFNIEIHSAGFVVWNVVVNFNDENGDPKSYTLTSDNDVLELSVMEDWDDTSIWMFTWS